MKVVAYSPQALVELLAEHSESDEAFVGRKQHKPFFEQYLATLGAATIVAEYNYVDRDYLQDFSGYYVSCFHRYERTTTRLHFFKIAFVQDDLDHFFAGHQSSVTADALRAAYLGFMVVKPLPQTVIGRTCLATYETGVSGTGREFPVVHHYVANFAGLKLGVNSLPFQEQDKVAAACATSALWSCFHATGRVFQHAIPSPTEITKTAVVSVPDVDVPIARAFPNRGLSAVQMANAITAVGLEPQVIAATDPHVVKTTLYAYLRCRIPLALVIALYDMQASAGPAKLRLLGRHAVAVAGYHVGSAAVPHGTTDFQLRAARIDKIYAHDDQLGPFARMRFDAIDISSGTAPTAGTIRKPVLATEWRSASGRVVAESQLMILPLYEKIRIPFNVIHDAILELDNPLERIRNATYRTDARIEWDIYLTTITDYKSEVLEQATTRAGSRNARILDCPLPRFIWRVTAMSAGDRWGDLLFDATGIEQSNLLLLADISNVKLMRMLKAVAQSPTFRYLQAHHTISSFTAAGLQKDAPLVLAP